MQMLNDTSSDECGSVIPRGAANLGFISSLVIIAIGIPGNGLTILALVKCAPKLLKNATTKFVINLAVADLIFCSVNLPMTSIRFLTCSWPFGELLCTIYPFLFYGNVAVSLMSITCITFNRLVLIAFGNYYKQIFSTRNIWFMIAFCWFFSFGFLSLPLFKIWGQFGEDTSTFSCTILKHNDTSPKKFLFLFGFLLPSLTIFFCYSIIWNRVRMSRSRSFNFNKKKTSKRDLKLTKMITIIFCVFVVCFAPTVISNVLIPKDRYPYFQVTASVLSWFNSCINPFIYFAMNRQYRNAFKRLVQPSLGPLVGYNSGKSNPQTESTLSNG